MIHYIIRRIIILIPLLFAISIMTFVIIQLPPGDYVTVMISRMVASSRHIMSDEEIARMTAQLTRQYGLDKSKVAQYALWIRNIILHGDFGLSFAYERPVSKLLLERIPFTIVMNVLSLLFVWGMALPIGIICAIRQNSAVDYTWSFIGFIGLATPNFVLALIAMWLAFKWFGVATVGLFSERYDMAAWSMGKVWDLMKHIWLPVVIVGTSGTAGMIRIMRNCLIDEIRKPYVMVKRAKGLAERAVMRAPIRIALNPFMSTIGYLLPGLISGEVLVSIVLNLPTTGPLMLNALLNQDMFLAGSILMILSVLSVLGTLMSDLILVAIDPRIRYEKVAV
jgi:peptide/nickel transport system permease protein